MISINLMIALIFLLGFVLIALYYFFIIKPEEDRLEHRVRTVALSKAIGLEESLSSELIAVKETQLEKRLNNFLRQDKLGYGFVSLKLLRSGLKQSLEKLIGIFVMLWILLSLGGWVILKIELIHSIGYAFVLDMFLFYVFVTHHEEKRKKQIISQLAPAIEIILRGVKAGSQIDKTFHIVARETPAPLKEEFIQMNSELDFGADFDKVLHASALRVNIPDYYFFTSALVIQRRAGGSLSDVLDNIITTLSKSHELRMKIKVFSSEAKTSGYVLSALPILALVVLAKTNPVQVEYFFYNDLGRKLLATATALLITAIITIRKMIKIEV